ncbi:MAG: glutathione binding-like protein [Halieaceae bacterium]
MIDLHYWPTPNGKKLTILLEEASIDYQVIYCNIGMGDQFADDFLHISPNNRMPAIVDQQAATDGKPLAIFESGACMMYLAEKYGQFGGADEREKWEVYQWLMWQMANQGPKMGERGHFRRLKDSEGDQSYALTRFTDETHRLYGVMNNRLYDRRYLAGDNYSIADMACYPWATYWEAQDIDLDEFKYVKRWYEELSERPAVQRGMAVGEEQGQDYSKLSDEEIARLKAMLYNQRARPAPASGGIDP